MENSIEVIKSAEILGAQFNIYGTAEEPLFLAKDVAVVIEYDLSSINKLVGMVDDEEKVRKIVPTPGGEQEMWMLTEDGLYEVLMQSRKPIAKQFKKGVKTILKEIRTNGGYIATTAEDSVEEIMAKALVVAQATLARREERIKALQEQTTEQQKQIEEAEQHVAILTHTNKTYTATEVGKECGFRSAMAFNDWLAKKKIQYKVNRTWVPTAEYADRAWFDIKQDVNDYGYIIYHRKITGIGRDAIIEIAKNDGLIK